MTSRTLALNFESYLRRNGRLTHDEELDLMEQGTSLQDHCGLLPNQYILPPRDLVTCRWIEQYDLTTQYGAHSLGSAEHALLTQRLTAGTLQPNAVAAGGYHELNVPPRADSVLAGGALGHKPRVAELLEAAPAIIERREELLETALIDIKRSIEEDPAFGGEIPLKRRKRGVKIDDDFEDEDEIPLKRRKQDKAPPTSAPKVKLKFRAPPQPSQPPQPRPKATAPTTSTPRKRTSTKDKNDDSDEEYQPAARPAQTTPLPTIYNNTALPYTLSTTKAPTSASTPTRTPSITSSGRSISPPPRAQLPSVTFKNGTRRIPKEIREIVAAVGKVRNGKDGFPLRTGLRNTMGFTGRDGVIGAKSVLSQWYGDTRLFTEKEWRYFSGNEERKRKRAGGR
ncbi:hypothetical protein DOTSEDRAFT_56548 [Dothistroma septosporum NZE10]|uniref:Uncharacterized protein n=1 Tax=Dothistroma septosporum (strain NZE10 / CBS 128990) TaxID=675120 RepID=N1PFH2_DOTSN|nr:hypothetical protein DOTSEDRAFT_56548 [Dothistroma septosporum NZE10]